MAVVGILSTSRTSIVAYVDDLSENSRTSARNWPATVAQTKYEGQSNFMLCADLQAAQVARFPGYKAMNTIMLQMVL